MAGKTAKVIAVDREGQEHEIEGTIGWSVMEVVREAGLPIEAACGGCCACATCHVYVDEAFLAKTGEQQEMEKSMLDFAENVQANSRLSCQITVTADLDGLRVTTPESQH